MNQHGCPQQVLWDLCCDNENFTWKWLKVRLGWKFPKLCVRQAIMTRYSKSEFCVFIILNFFFFIIYGKFSSNLIIFKVHNVCSQHNFKKHIFSIISIGHVRHTCHICQLPEKNYCIRQSVNCWKDMTDCLLNVEGNLKY